MRREEEFKLYLWLCGDSDKIVIVRMYMVMRLGDNTSSPPYVVYGRVR